MSMTKEEKAEIIKENKHNENDTGSAGVQIALVTQKIVNINDHLKENKKDHNSKRSLLKLVGKRKKLQDYLKRKDKESYQALIKKLGLRK